MSLFSSNEEHFCTPFALHNKTNTPLGHIDISHLGPENEYGNIEYKLKLTNPTEDRIERLVTQLKWRIREGNGEAILYLGVKDNGTFVGLTPEEIRLSLKTLETMSSKIGAKMSVVSERIVESEYGESSVDFGEPTGSKGKVIRNKHRYQSLKDNSKEGNDSESENIQDAVRWSSASTSYRKNNQASVSHRKGPPKKVLQILFKRKTHDISEELRVAVLGPTESGKSSLLGVLSHGSYDNGRGSSRLNLFRHRHEIRSGHTSSISQEIFGFNQHGQPLTYKNCLSTEEIVESSTRIVTLIDLAGHQRYLSTTLFGLGSHSPDIVLVVVSAISTITSFTMDHVSLALGMEKSVAVVINKIDLVSREIQENCFDDIVKALQLLHPDITPIPVKGMNDAIEAGTQLNLSNVIPVFFTSCVFGSGLKLLYEFFNVASPKEDLHHLSDPISHSSELHVDETFELPGIGTVVSGLIVEGIIREGDEMLLGPDDLGNFSLVSIMSLQRHKIPCNFAKVGQKCTMAISESNSSPDKQSCTSGNAASKFKVRRGMVMKEYDSNWNQNFSVCLQFCATVKFISDTRYKLSKRSQVSVYIGNVKQTCAIINIKRTSPSVVGLGGVLSSTPPSRPADLWLVELKFTKRPEYVREGSRLILRHALVKGIGIVSRVTRLPRGRYQERE